jgi:hypothetical protein
MIQDSLLTITMIVYNEEKYIATAIPSILAQTFRDYNFFIINNGSTDGTLSIIEHFASQDSRITVINKQENDPAYGYKVFDLVKTPYYMSAAGHDFYLPQYVEKCLARLQSDPRIVLAYSKTMFLKDDKIFGPIPAVFETMEMSPINRSLFVAGGLVEAYQQYGIFRFDALIKVKIHHELAFDHIMLSELALLGMFALIDEPLFYLRQAATWGNVSVYRKKHFPDEANGVKPFLQMLAAFIEIADGCPDPIDRQMFKLAMFTSCTLRYKSILEMFDESLPSLFALSGFKELYACIEQLNGTFANVLLPHYTSEKADTPLPTGRADAAPSPAPMPSLEAGQLCPCRSNKRFRDCHGDLAWIRLLNTSIPTVAADKVLLGQALFYAKRGNLPLADLLVRSQIAQNPADADSLALLAEIALKIGKSRVALECLTGVLGILDRQKDQPERAAAVRSSLALLNSYEEEPAGADGRPKYLLIKAWGYGFWSDVDHLLGALLLAELTGRTPVVHWGENTLFGDPECTNAFDLYFEPVSEPAIGQLVGGDLSYYPPKWRSDNLLQENVDKWSGPYSRQSGILFFGRNEDVVVSDFHTPVAQLLPWIDKSSPYSQMKWHEIYRHLYAKYLVLKPQLAERIEEFYRQNMQGHQWLGVHVRGSDKILEQRDLERLNQEYYSQIDSLLSYNKELRIFLLTDSSTYLQAFIARYGDRILTTDAIRTDGEQGVHLMGHSGKEVGQAVIFDSYLGARCDYFLGNGGSNVSAAVGSLKAWEEGRFKLLGRDLRSNINVTIHNW